MPRTTHRELITQKYVIHTILRDQISPPDDADEATRQLQMDLAILDAIKNTRYLRARDPVPKSGNLHLAWNYAQSPAHDERYLNMMRVSPTVFDVILDLIKDHPAFFNNSNVPQKPVEQQLAATLFRMGRYGNGASVEDVARVCGSSEGDVVNATRRCFDAIESLHDIFI